MAFTKFTHVQVDGTLTAKIAQFEGLGGVISAVTLSKAVDYALTAAEKKLYIGVTATAASKTVTLGLAAGQVALVHNAGATNAFTLKNVAGDTGTSLAAGKVALVVGSDTANASVIVVLN